MMSSSLKTERPSRSLKKPQRLKTTIPSFLSGFLLLPARVTPERTFTRWTTRLHTRWSPSSASDAAQRPPLRPPLQPHPDPSSGPFPPPHGPGPQPARGAGHHNQTERRLQAGTPGGAQREPHARRAPRLRVPLPGPGGQLAVRRAVAHSAPPSGQRGFEGGAEQLRARAGHPGKDSAAVGGQPGAGQEPPVHGGLQGRPQHGGETEGGARVKPTQVNVPGEVKSDGCTPGGFLKVHIISGH